jgi:hypothetical protein
MRLFIYDKKTADEILRAEIMIVYTGGSSPLIWIGDTPRGLRFLAFPVGEVPVSRWIGHLPVAEEVVRSDPEPVELGDVPDKPFHDVVAYALLFGEAAGPEADAAP